MIADKTTAETPRAPYWAFILGLPLLATAIFLQSVTVASGSYAGLLITALALLLIANIFFIYAYRQGGIGARILSILCILPSMLVILDLFRRATHVFGH